MGVPDRRLVRHLTNAWWPNRRLVGHLTNVWSGRRRPVEPQASMIDSPDTLTSLAGSAFVAGPLFTLPSAIEKLLL